MSGDEPSLFEGQEDELVRRLRGLEWPAVSPEVRDRCWREFERQLGTGAPAADPPPEQARRNATRRESYTRRVPVARQPLGGYVRAPRLWQERPGAAVRRAAR